MAEPAAAGPRCPPHHWLIAAAAGTAHAQLWTCCRCAAQQEVVSPPAKSWYTASRIKRPEPPASTTAPLSDEHG